LQITYTNIPGLYASALFLCIQIVAFFKLTNLSLIEDDTFHLAQSKTLLQKDQNEVKSKQIASSMITEETPQMIDDRNPTKSGCQKGDRSAKNKAESDGIISFFASALHSVDIMLIFCTTFFFAFSKFMIEMWVPILLRDDLKWSQNIVYISFLASGFVLVVFMTPVTLKKMSPRVIFKLYMSLIPMLSISMLVILLQFLYPKNLKMDICMSVVFVLSFGSSNVAHNLMISMLSLFVPNCSIAKGESTRILFTRLGAILGTLLGGITFLVITITVPILIACSVILYIIFLIRTRSFLNPTTAF